MKNNKAVFAAGCFWGVQFYFDQVPGVIKTTVGYIGGHTKNPSYEEVCTHATGHAEAVLIEFDPNLVLAGVSKASMMQGDAEQHSNAFRVLLKQFFRMHDPTQLNRQGPDIGDSYRSAIFYFNDEQKKLAEKTKEQLQPNFDKPIVTQIVQASEFYEAEDYHQKFTKRTGRGMCHVAYTPVS